MVHKVEIKDKDKQISVALRSLGYRLGDGDVETILNVVDFIRNNKEDTTIRDIITIRDMVQGLYENT